MAIYFMLLTELAIPRICNYVILVANMTQNNDLNRIKVMLAEKKKTSKWLAEQLGKDPATISKWCTNASQPSLELLVKIADLLEVNYTDLLRIEIKQ